MHWARIRRDADFTKRANYQFWLPSKQWGPWTSGKLDDLQRVEGLDVQAQGAVIKCPELAPEGKPYMWVCQPNHATCPLLREEHLERHRRGSR